MPDEPDAVRYFRGNEEAAGVVAAAAGLGTVISHGVLVTGLAPSTILYIASGAVFAAVSSMLQFGLERLVGRFAGRFGVGRIVLRGLWRSVPVRA